MRLRIPIGKDSQVANQPLQLLQHLPAVHLGDQPLLRHDTLPTELLLLLVLLDVAGLAHVVFVGERVAVLRLLL